MTTPPRTATQIAELVTAAVNMFHPEKLSAEISKRSPVRPVVTLVDDQGRWYRLIIEPSAPEPACGEGKDTPRGESTPVSVGEPVEWIERQSGPPYPVRRA